MRWAALPSKGEGEAYDCGVGVAVSPLESALAVFHARHPTYKDTRALDELRRTDYARLDREGHVYLDYTGGGLFAESQVRQHMDLLLGNVFGNPHSTSPTSGPITEIIEKTRARVLAFFNASPDEYTVAFTSNATGALKLVGESYPFGPGGHFLLTFDNHNSVNGIREYARAAGAETTYVTVRESDLRVDRKTLEGYLSRLVTGEAAHAGGCLFAYPAQSNFSGVQHPLELIEAAHEKGWDVLLDAAAFVPTNRLDLGRHHPDFVAISFYKMFGYPTGIGCLIARKEALIKLKRPWFAGGTIVAVSVRGDWHMMSRDESGLEDGTPNYLDIPAVSNGLDHLSGIGVDMIHQRVMNLTDWLLQTLSALRHSNGKAIVRIYGPTATVSRGANIALNFLQPDGQTVDERLVDQLAANEHISIRTGCFCNPGAGEVALHIVNDEMPPEVDGRQMTMGEYLELLGLPTAGAVRVSMGVATNFDDVWKFAQFAQTFTDKTFDRTGLPARLKC